MKNFWGHTLIKHGLAAAALALSCIPLAMAANRFPTKTVRIVVPSAAGGLADVTARLVAKKMSENLGQPVIVDNRPGADTLLGTRLVKDAPADGYTLLLQSDGIAVWPALMDQPGYNLEKDFAGVGPILKFPFVLVVGPQQPDKTLAGFMARAKANPKTLSYASGGVGTPSHIAAAIFLQQTGLDVLHVPYKGNAAAITDIVGGRVDMLFDTSATSAGNIKTGKLRALGVSSNTRLQSLPDVPTFAEQGVHNASYYSWIGLLAPAATPKDVLQRLSEALRSAVSSEELNEKFRSDGSEPMVMSPEEFNKYLKGQLGQMSKLAADLKLPKRQ
ncbi:Bug family tripartite tricarboxylate transporter substrate binding protein [Cupriavidus sp. CuC1]|uniref:Bug family tripartite tricarboxylate transporter substrate binding protein n=1 Tax=Cupriavidus sp. CuC1 TaxID=3373131 RepID=UPI0037D19D9C